MLDPKYFDINKMSNRKSSSGLRFKIDKGASNQKMGQ